MEHLVGGYPVVIKFPVQWGDMDAFQHVNNVSYFRYLENARLAYFENFDIIGFIAKNGVGPILAATSCRFKAPLITSCTSMAFTVPFRSMSGPVLEKSTTKNEKCSVSTVT